MQTFVYSEIDLKDITELVWVGTHQVISRRMSLYFSPKYGPMLVVLGIAFFHSGGKEQVIASGLKFSNDLDVFDKARLYTQLNFKKTSSKKEPRVYNAFVNYFEAVWGRCKVAHE